MVVVLIVVIVVPNGVFGFVQDYRAEQSLESLRELTAPTATVRRDGEVTEIEATEIVPGDVVEALVGDLRDEFDMDEREPSIRRRGDEGDAIDGGVPLSKITDIIEGDFTSEEAEMIGGLVLEQLNRAPERGDRDEVARVRR